MIVLLDNDDVIMGGNESSLGGVPKDSLIAEIVKVAVQKTEVTLSIIARCYPTASWHVGSLQM